MKIDESMSTRQTTTKTTTMTSTTTPIVFDVDAGDGLRRLHLFLAPKGEEIARALQWLRLGLSGNLPPKNLASDGFDTVITPIWR